MGLRPIRVDEDRRDSHIVSMSPPLQSGLGSGTEPRR